MKTLSAPGAPFQYAWHVPNLENAAKYWAENLGIGPFFSSEVDSSQYDGFQYRGGEGILQMRLAWAQSKEGQIELIEVNSKEPNVYHDLVAPEKTAFHHVGIWSDNYHADKRFLSSSYEIAMDMGKDTNICYFDTAEVSGNMIELIERNDGILGLFGLIKKAADEWDGTKPLRTMAELTG